jgi:hypothetical protein
MILAVGAVGAYVLLKPKTTATGAKAPSLLSSLLGKPTAKPLTTNLATGNGTRTTAGYPTTVQSLTPAQIAALTPAQRAQLTAAQVASLTPAQRAALGLAPAPTLAQQFATGGIAGLLNGLANAFKGTPATAAAAAPKPTTSSGGGAPAGGSSGGSSGGSQAQRPGTSPTFGYDPYSDPANYDAYGNYVGEGAWDANGNYVGPGDVATAGMFDPNAPSPYDFSGPIDTSSYQAGGADFAGPIDTSSYQPGGADFAGPIDTSSYQPGGADFAGPIDENGNVDPMDEYGLGTDWTTGDGAYDMNPVGSISPDDGASASFDPGVTVGAVDTGWYDDSLDWTSMGGGDQTGGSYEWAE